MKPWLKVVNLGVDGLSEKEKHAVQIINVVAVIAAAVSFMYLVLYFILGTIVPAVINICVIIFYSMTVLLTYKRKYQIAKIWIFSIYMIHLLCLSQIIFSKDAGFHFYYFVVPITAFLVFDYKELKIKYMLTAISVLLFFAIEIAQINEPYIQLSHNLNRLLYLTSILIAFSGGMTVVVIFTNNINKYENEQHRLIKNLQNALSEVKVLRGFIPICSSCKKIRDDKGFWNQIESYIQERSDAEFSHGICPECAENMYGQEQWYRDIQKGQKQNTKKNE